MNRRIPAALGAVLAVVGLAALVAPGILLGLPTNQTVVVVLGFVLVLGGLREVRRRRSNPPDYAETAETEEAIELPTPGDDFDHRFDVLGMTRYRVGERERLRDDVAEVAEETLIRRRGLSPEAARRALDEGTWTDDPFAAALFTGQPPDVGRVAQIREFFQMRPAFKARATRTAAELDRLVRSDLTEGGDETTGDGGIDGDE